MEEKPETPQTTQETPKQSNSKPLSKTIILILIISFFILSGLIALRNLKLTQQLSQQQIQPTPTPTLIPTAEWKTYRNEEFGFELRYPEDFFSKEYSSRNSSGEKFSVSFADKKWESPKVHNPQLTVRVIVTELSPREWLEENYDPAFIPPPGSYSEPPFGYRNVQDTTVNGRAAIKFQFLTTSDSSISTVIQGNLGTLYSIDAISSGFGNFPPELYTQILSTFKFLE